jgi:uncharacterized protein (DUF736 family)
MPKSRVHAGHDEPTAAWIIGQDAYTGQDYIVHLEAPAFVAKLGHNPDDGILSGLSYATSDDRSIYDFVWFDECPSESDFHELMSAAEHAIQAYRHES